MCVWVAENGKCCTGKRSKNSETHNGGSSKSHLQAAFLMNFYVCDVPEKKGKTATVAKTPKEREFSLKERQTETERGRAALEFSRSRVVYQLQQRMWVAVSLYCVVLPPTRAAPTHISTRHPLDPPHIPKNHPPTRCC